MLTVEISLPGNWARPIGDLGGVSDPSPENWQPESNWSPEWQKTGAWKSEGMMVQMNFRALLVAPLVEQSSLTPDVLVFHYLFPISILISATDGATRILQSPYAAS